MNSPDMILAAGLLAVLAFLALGAVMALRHRRERREWRAQLDSMIADHRAASDTIAHLGRRLQAAETQIAQLQARMDTAPPAEPLMEADHAYAQAIRMVRRGADAARLVTDFGLTRGEAELVARLHGRKTG